MTPQRQPVEAPWEIERIVGELRASRREESSIPRDSLGEDRERPSRPELIAVIAALRAALFPAHFGPAHLSEESTDYFVGYTLDGTLRSLLGLVRRTLRQEAFRRLDSAPGEEQASSIVRTFFAQLPEIRRVLGADIQAAFEGDPAATSLDEVLFCYPGVTAILHHRLAHALHRLGVPLLARMIAELAHADTGIDIHPGAEIGERFFIDHGTGVVIGETATLGRRVRLYQGVTLGARRFPLDERGIPIKGQARHPIIEDDVTIYAGATILGRVTIGAGSSIGGNVWLTRSVPPGSRVTQAHAQAEAFDNGAGI